MTLTIYLASGKVTVQIIMFPGHLVLSNDYDETVKVLRFGVYIFICNITLRTGNLIDSNHHDNSCSKLTNPIL